MKSAEFKTYREALGIDRRWLADQLQVSRRTIQRWEDPRADEVPSFAADWMLSAWNAALDDVVKSVDYVESMTDEYGAPKQVGLQRYATDESARIALGGDTTARMHAARVALIAAALESLGFQTSITWITPED